MRNYEIMFIVKPTLGDEDLEKTVKSFETIIKDNAGNLDGVTDMGQRELAYEIKDFKNGHYYLFEVSSKSDACIKEFDRLALISNDIIRHLITKKGN